MSILNALREESLALLKNGVFTVCAWGLAPVIPVKINPILLNHETNYLLFASFG
jgi:hypothetical protein